MMLWASPETQAGSACYDHFGDNGADPENYWGLAAEEDLPAALAMLEHLACKLPHHTDSHVAYSDGGDSIVLLIHKKDWRRKDVQAAWSRVIATPLERLVKEADIGNDGQTIEHICSYWDGQGIADRVREMIYMRNAGHIDTDDLSAAILDDAPGWIVQGIIAAQTAHMMDI